MLSVQRLTSLAVMNALGEQLARWRALLQEETLSAEERAERAWTVMRHHADIEASCCCPWLFDDLTAEEPS